MRAIGSSDIIPNQFNMIIATEKISKIDKAPNILNKRRKLLIISQKRINHIALY